MEDKEEINNDVNIIKHIVISGGGVAGFSFYGALRESSKKGTWNIDNIQSIYGTSVGSILAVMLSLKYDWDTVDDYLIKRPWQNLYKFNIYSMLDAIQNRGIFNIKVIEETLLPLFSGKDLSIDITMKQLYDMTNIDLHIFTTELHSFTMVDISHKTHPDWKVTDAVYCSSALPILFSPYLIEDKCYCDGGILMNYALSCCIENGANPKEILGVKTVHDNMNNREVNAESNLFDYGILILRRAIEKVLIHPIKDEIEIEYRIISKNVSLYDILNTAASMEERIRLINRGNQGSKS